MSCIYCMRMVEPLKEKDGWGFALICPVCKNIIGQEHRGITLVGIPQRVIPKE